MGAPEATVRGGRRGLWIGLLLVALAVLGGALWVALVEPQARGLLPTLRVLAPGAALPPSPSPSATAHWSSQQSSWRSGRGSLHEVRFELVLVEPLEYRHTFDDVMDSDYATLLGVDGADRVPLARVELRFDGVPKAYAFLRRSGAALIGSLEAPLVRVQGRVRINNGEATIELPAGDYVLERDARRSVDRPGAQELSQAIWSFSVPADGPDGPVRLSERREAGTSGS